MTQTYTWTGGGITIAGGVMTGVVSIAPSTDIAVTDGGTGASTAQDARTNLLPTKSGNALKVLRVNAGETDYELATAAGGGPATQLDANGTTLDVDAIVDGEYLKRVGTTIVSAAVSGGSGLTHPQVMARSVFGGPF